MDFSKLVGSQRMVLWGKCSLRGNVEGNELSNFFVTRAFSIPGCSMEYLPTLSLFFVAIHSWISVPVPFGEVWD